MWMGWYHIGRYLPEFLLPVVKTGHKEGCLKEAGSRLVYVLSSTSFPVFFFFSITQRDLFASEPYAWLVLYIMERFGQTKGKKKMY